ncbi:hypothetical protein PQ459_00885 [Chryseobacterium sp. KACC 21268]|nr:hypothetical protein PQ459_00885 [Chryseobacterium sp. KACC 21268]
MSYFSEQNFSSGKVEVILILTCEGARMIQINDRKMNPTRYFRFREM